MIAIETPPRLEETNGNEQLLRDYLYRTVLSLETQLQMLEERIERMEANG